MICYNGKLKPLASKLRNGMTMAELKLWSKIRRKQVKGYQFYRQRIIENYIVDFYCPKINTVIEVDGGQHYDTKGKEEDRIRDTKLSLHGIKVLRYSDRDVLINTTAVLEDIFNKLP